MFTEQDIQLNENIKKNLLPFPHPFDIIWVWFFLGTHSPVNWLHVAHDASAKDLLHVSSTMNNRVEKT